MASDDDLLAGGATLRGFAEGQRVFNRYRLERVLGRGGMGVVWLAFDEALEREVALKFVPELVCLDAEAIADLKRETRRSLEITHPNIVRIYDFEQDEKTAAITMEYVDGKTLAALKVERRGCLGLSELRLLLGRLCEALDYAHLRAKVVHRDLKPANLMVTADGELKITDFGISCSISDSVSRVSLARGTSGTPVFMSPQQMMGERPTVADDIYALGATIYDLLAGKPPFYRGDVLTQLREVEPPSMASRRGELGLQGDPIPEAWEAAVRLCLAKDPAARPGSAGDVLSMLGGTLNTQHSTTNVQGQSEAAGRRAQTPSLAGGPRSKVPWFAYAGLAVAVLAGLMVVPSFIPPKGGRTPEQVPVQAPPAPIPPPSSVAATPIEPPAIKQPEPPPAPVPASPPMEPVPNVVRPEPPKASPPPPVPVTPPPAPEVEAPQLVGRQRFAGTAWEGSGVVLRVRPAENAAVAGRVSARGTFDVYPMAGRFWFVREAGGSGGWAELSEVRLLPAAWAQVAYVARLGRNDLRNSRGERLTELRDILRQDRANYHSSPLTDLEDQGDEVFGEKDNREWFEDAQVSLVNPSGNAIEGALVRVDAARGRIQATVVSE